MRDRPTMRVESRSGAEDQGVMTAAIVGDLDDVTRGKHAIAGHPGRLAQVRRSSTLTPSSEATT